MEHVDVMRLEVEETWNRLNEIWAKVGYDEDSLSRRQNAVVKHVKELLKDMKQEAEDKLNDCQQKLNSLMQEISQLAKDLSLENVPELEVATGKTLLEIEAIFLDIVTGLRKRKAIRMEKYEKINVQVIEISKELDEEPMKIEFEGIPADSQVSKLEQHLAYLHQEKSRRLERYLGYRTTFSELSELLERSPKSELEHLVLVSDEISSNHPVSSAGIKALSNAVLDRIHDIIVKLNGYLEANTEDGERVWEKIRELWSRLNADEEMMSAFFQVHRPISTASRTGIYKPSVLKGLHKELERLEEEKRQNMGLFIRQVREELVQIWLNQCFMTSVEVRFTEPNFLGITTFTISDFTCEEFLEDLLEKHEMEVQFWREFVERNKKLIDAVTKRGHMFAQYKTLDQKSDDPSRLANRGGALLKEEKERKKLEKAIPKLESELKGLCEAFERDADDGNGMTKFLVYERTVHEMIEQDWEVFHEEKRLRKEAKKKPNEGGTVNKTLMTTQLGPPGNRKRPHTPSSQKGLVTPNKRNRTQQPMTPGKSLQSPFVHPGPGSSVKRPFVSESSATDANRNGKAKAGQIKLSTKTGFGFSNNKFARHNASAAQAASRRAVRKSIGKLRSGSSLMSNPVSSSSSDQSQKSSLSQPNLTISSLEQLDFSKVVRGPILEVLKESHTPPKRTSSKENFACPSASGSSRNVKKTPVKTMLTRQASSGKIPVPTKTTGKEQIPPTQKHSSKETLVSPVSSYSEFTDHLLCQSTLNSSAFVPLHKQKPTTAAQGSATPTKSAPGMPFTPCKPLADNCF